MNVEAEVRAVLIEVVPFCIHMYLPSDSRDGCREKGSFGRNIPYSEDEVVSRVMWQ